MCGEQLPQLRDGLGTEIGERQAGHLGADGIEHDGVHSVTFRGGSAVAGTALRSTVANSSSVVMPAAAAITAMAL
jgi:hypothetical protein